MSSIKASDLLRRQDELAQLKSPWITYWEEISRYCCPRRSSYYSQTPAENKALPIYDSTPILALDTCASGLHGQLSSTHRPFFSLKTSDSELMKDDSVREWVQDTTRRVMWALQDSNWNLMIHEHYLDLAAIGTACIYMEEHRTRPGRLFFSALHMSEVYISANDYDVIDTVFRKTKFSARQAVQKFGYDSLSRDIQQAHEKSPEKTATYLHCVYPRTDYDPDVKTSDQKPWASIWLETDSEHIISEGGYDDFPYVVPRWSVSTGEIYGRGPGTNAIEDMKMLNKVAKTLIQASEREVDPPINVPSAGYIPPLDLNPGGRNFYHSGSTDRIEPILTRGNLSIGEETLIRLQTSIRQAWYNDLFMLLAERPNMTATEVMERVQEKMVLLGPTIGRLKEECFSPAIGKAINILAKSGQLQPMPELLADADFRLDFVSQLDQGQRIYETNSIVKYYQVLLPLAQAQPDVLDVVNVDATARELADLMGVPATLINDDKQVAEIRQQRAEMMAAEQQKMDMERAAAGAADVAKAGKDFAAMRPEGEA